MGDGNDIEVPNFSIDIEIQKDISVILLHEKSGRTFCPKTIKTFRTFSKNLGQNFCQSN